MSPFKALYWQDPPSIFQGSSIPSNMEEFNRLTADKDELLSDLRANLLKSLDSMRQVANKHRREVVFQLGDWVYLKLQPYKRRSLARRLNEKLSPRFYGPLMILDRI